MAQVITLLSAQGAADVSISLAKAALAQLMPGAVFADISHSAAQNDLRQAAYILQSSYRHFPAGTIHIIPLDIFSSRPYRMLLAEADGFFFIAPDNGFLPLLLGHKAPTRLCSDLPAAASFADWIRHCAPVMKAIEAGDTASFRDHAFSARPHIPVPVTSRDGIDCSVLHIDRFGNVVLDITAQQFRDMIGDKPFRIKLMRAGDITTLNNNYNDVPSEKPLCRFNAAGFLEIAINRGNAATALGLSGHDAVAIRYRKVKIFAVM